MKYVDIVAILAIVQFIAFGLLVGSARGKYGVKAPAVTGSEPFERMYRVQMNTLELLVAFLPGLFMASRYWSPHWVAAIGTVYLIGRLIYWRAYTTAPATRGLGFMLSFAPIIVLLLAALAGALGLVG